MPFAWRCLALILLSLCTHWLPVVQSQSYIPQPGDVLNCPAGSRGFQLGNDVITDYPIIGKTPEEYTSWTARISTGNYTGGSLRWLSLGLGDNRALPASLDTRLALFLRVNNSLSLLAQTTQVTVNPSGPQILYAALSAPVTLTYGAEYVVGMTTMGYYFSQFVTGQTAPAPHAGFYSWKSGALISFDYDDNNDLRENEQPFLPLSALGCIADELQPQPFSSPISQLYSFCSYTQQSAPAPDPDDYSQQATSVLSVYSGLLALSTVTGSSAFGQYNDILAATAVSTVTNSGGYLDADGTAVTSSLMLGGSVIEPPASNLLYLSGAAANIDTDGISLLSAQGLQTVLRYSSSGGSINTVNSAGVMTSSSLSSFSIQLYSGNGYGLDPLASLPSCSPPLVKHFSPALTCSDGSAYMQYGWSSAAFNPMIRYGTPWAYYAQLMGNNVHFFAFTSQVAGSVVQELSMMLGEAVGKVLHLRLGLFAPVNGSDGSYSLLQQTAELTLLNPAYGLVSAPLLSPITLQAATYYIGVWVDQAVRTPYLHFGFQSIAALGYNSVGGGQFPPLVSLSRLSSYGRLVSARVCVPQQKVVQYAFCATFFHQTNVVTYSGVLDVLEQPYSNEQGQYRVVVAANGSRISRAAGSGSETVNPLTLGRFSSETNNFLYQAGNAGYAVDISGLSFLVQQSDGDIMSYVLSLRNVSKLGQPAPELSYEETEKDSSSYSPPKVLISLNASFAAQPGVVAPTCIATAPSFTPYSPPQNKVLPASAPRLSCDPRQDKVAINFGDQYIADYEKRATGATLPGNTVYTTQFTAIAGATLLQLSVAVLDNQLAPPQPIALRLGVYQASTLQLLSQTAETLLYQVKDQVLTVNLTSTLLLPDAGLYWIALLANNSLVLATSNLTSPTMALQYSAAGLSPTFVVTAGSAAASLALSALGCASATHFICAYFQYYEPTPYKATETYAYQGLLVVDSAAAYSTRFGLALPVTGGSGYMNQYRIYQSVAQRSFQPYILELRGASNVYLQPSSAAVLDTIGLQLLVNGGKAATRLYYSHNASAVVESVRGNLVFSSVVVIPLNASSGLPGCSITAVPSYRLGAAPPTPSCAAASSLVTYGDATPTDLQYERGGNVLWQMASSLRRFRSSASNYTQLQWLSFGVEPNPGSLLRITLQLWDLQLQVIASTGQFSAANTREETLVAPLLSPVFLSPNTDYYVSALISDYVHAPGAATFGPEVGTNSYAGLIRALGAVGCLSGPPPPQSSSSSSTASVSLSAMRSSSSSSPSLSLSSAVAASSASASEGSSGSSVGSSGGSSVAMMPWSSSASSATPRSASSSSSWSAAVEPSSVSSGSSWSNGEVVGVVLGCVVGSNVLLLLLLWACWVRRGGWLRSKSTDGSRRSGYDSERSRGSSRAEHETSQVEFNIIR